MLLSRDHGTVRALPGLCVGISSDDDRFGGLRQVVPETGKTGLADVRGNVAGMKAEGSVC